jgi:hypothetical protein
MGSSLKNNSTQQKNSNQKSNTAKNAKNMDTLWRNAEPHTTHAACVGESTRMTNAKTQQKDAFTAKTTRIILEIPNAKNINTYNQY